MRKKILSIFALCVLLGGCKNKEPKIVVEEPTLPEGVVLETVDEDGNVIPSDTKYIIVNIQESEESETYKQMQVFEAYVESRDSSLQVEIVNGASAVSEEGKLLSLQHGKIGMALFSREAFMEQSKFLNMFDSMFLLLNYDHFHEMWQDKVGKAMLQQISEDYNIHVTNAIYTDTKVYNAKGVRDIHSVEDFEALTMLAQTSEYSIDQIKVLGSRAVVGVPSKTYRYLADRTINCYDAYLKDLYSEKYYEITDELIDSKHVYNFDFIAISNVLWDSFTKEQKELVEEAIQIVVDNLDKETLNKRIDTIRYYKNYGLNIDELNQEEFFYLFQQYYRNQPELTQDWNMDYYERILKLGISILMRQEEEENKEDVVISGQ